MSVRQAITRPGSAPRSFSVPRWGVLQRKCACGGSSDHDGECEECRSHKIGVQRQATAASGPSIAPPIVHDALQGSGQPLDAATRTFMEPRFGHDFAQVRVHTDAQAAASAQAVSALAYTVGRDIVFAAGQYAPRTTQGQRLLAHELTHVVQQGTSAAYGSARSRHDDLVIGPVDDALEREAHDAATTGDRISCSGFGAASAVLRRQTPDQGQPGAREGGTLPYREATELAECIRIMGQESSDYCREQVLGEVPQPTPPPAPPPPCDPQGLPRAQYLTQPGTSTGDFGLTTLAGTVTTPVVHTTRARGGVRIDATAAALPPITSVFTQAGTFTEGTAIFVSQGGDCRSGRYDIRWTILPDGARKIREGELEHCADFQYAFDISLRRYADAVNTLAASGRVFPNQRAAEAHVTRLVGAAPGNWGAIFACLAGKTTSRDGAHGYRGWHTPRPHSIPPRLDTSCAFTRQVIGGTSLPDVGQHPPSEIIKDCGEVPARAGGAGGRRR
ncbi:MAG TPA: DUF4157 domain-containing protein [Herpetosiphonaceae bacterium]